METFILENDVELVCARASSFPAGVLDAFQRLHRAISTREGRNYFSVSWFDERGEIEYLAGATELYQNELERAEFQRFTIPSGRYTVIDVHNFMDDIPAIGNAFKQLLPKSNSTESTVCVEWYVTDKLCRCMVKSNN